MLPADEGTATVFMDCHSKLTQIVELVHRF